jgi:hypothetical protein
MSITTAFHKVEPWFICDGFKDKDMGGACSTYGNKNQCLQIFGKKNQKGTDHL